MTINVEEIIPTYNGGPTEPLKPLKLHFLLAAVDASSGCLQLKKTDSRCSPSASRPGMQPP